MTPRLNAVRQALTMLIQANRERSPRALSMEQTVATNLAENMGLVMLDAIAQREGKALDLLRDYPADEDSNAYVKSYRRTLWEADRVALLAEVDSEEGT